MIYINEGGDNMTKMKENSKAYDREAANLALSVVEIKPCVYCGHPVIDGYCCNSCGSDSPTLTNQECSLIEI